MMSRWTKLAALMVAAMLPAVAFAQEHGQAAAEHPWNYAVGAGIAMGLAILGAGLGQGILAARAMEGMARNPQAGGRIQIAMLLALAFPESLVLFGLVIAYMLVSKGVIGLASGLIMGLAILGAGLGQGLLARSAMDGMARNPQAGGRIQIAMLLALAFPESLVLFGLVIAYMGI
ncbi:MAG: ATP synthase F0 subunit C [Pseudomonadota bacterium]